jgi:hypothetical protein
VDVRIIQASPGTSKDEIVAALLRHTKMNAPRAAEVADLILAAQKVQIEIDSQQTAHLLAEDLRNAGCSATVEK